MTLSERAWDIARGFLSRFGFKALPGSMVAERIPNLKMERDIKFQREQIRAFPIKWSVTDTWVRPAAGLPPIPAAIGRSVVVGVYKASVTQQVVGFHLNAKWDCLEALPEFHIFLSRSINPAIMATPNGENTSVYEETHVVNEPTLVNVNKVYPMSIEGPSGLYLNLGEKIYIHMGYSVANIPLMPVAAILTGSINLDFIPSFRQQQVTI